MANGTAVHADCTGGVSKECSAYPPDAVLSPGESLVRGPFGFLARWAEPEHTYSSCLPASLFDNGPIMSVRVVPGVASGAVIGTFTDCCEDVLHMGATAAATIPIDIVTAGKP